MTFMPQMLLSGFMFPFEGMPKAVQYLAETFPLTHFLRIVRGIVTKGTSLPALSADIWPLVVFFLLGLVIAALRFSKRLDWRSKVWLCTRRDRLGWLRIERTDKTNPMVILSVRLTALSLFSCQVAPCTIGARFCLPDWLSNRIALNWYPDSR